MMHMPGNFPPVEGAGDQLAGMGTPDLEGTYGTFTYYTDDPLQTPTATPGGRIVPITPNGNHIVLPVTGPPNTLRRDRAPAVLNLVADIDPDEPVMRGRIAGQQFILRQGEWSPWIRVRFPLLGPLAGASGMFRLYARELHPGVHIYCSPLNLDPDSPALPLSAPAGFGRDLARRAGPFYTQGIAEDTAALRQGEFTLPEYLQQSRLVAEERSRLLTDCLSRFHDGLLFFYFSEIDQNSHVLWGAHESELVETYQAVDHEIGRVMAAASDATVIVMSDHGFAAFDRAVNLNTWLWRAGFLALDDPRNAGPTESFAHVDWKNTRAYALGLNALYLNLAGREKHGIVQPGAEAAAVLAQLSGQLREFRDPDTGRNPITAVTPIAAPANRAAPDLEIGYAPGYRASWETGLGAVPPDVLRLNADAWIGDHCIAAADVPGVLLGTRRPHIPDPGLKDLTVTVLEEFGISPEAAMTGRAVY
jgi:hypothetical protein